MQETTRLALSGHLQRLLQAMCGTGAGETHTRALRRLARDVHDLSGQYVFAHPPGRRPLDRARQARAYLAYYLPVNLIKLHPILDETAPLGVFEREAVSILDLGCGPGTASLGVLEYLAARMPAGLRRIAVRGIDRMAENVVLARELVQAYSRSGALPAHIRWDIRFEQGSIAAPADIARAASPLKGFTVIAAGNVITEIAPESFGTLAACMSSHLEPGGAAILLDPGTCRSSKKLYRLREAIVETTPLHLYAPCPGTGACPLQNDPDSWCHEKVFWEPPPLVRAIDRQIGFSKAKGVAYSYCTFIRQRTGLAEKVPGYAPDTLWRVVSYRIRTKGEDRLYVCNGSERRLLRRLGRNASATNLDFIRARRGDIAFINGAIRGQSLWEMPPESSFVIARPARGAGPGSQR